MSAPRLIYTGQTLIDLVLRVARLPAPGDDLAAHDALLVVGGGFNTMVAARRQGLSVLYTGGHGRGRFGDMVRDALATEDIAYLAGAVIQRDTGLCTVLVDDAAERSFISHAGAERRIDAATLGALTLTADDTVHISGYSLLDADPAAVLLDWLEACSANVEVVFDPGPRLSEIDAEIQARVRACTTILSANRLETLILAGVSTLDAARPRLIGRFGSETRIVVRDGANGCYVYAAGAWQYVPGFPVQAIDTNGAGDAHTGVLIARLIENNELRDAARIANAAAALAATQLGPASAPSRAELEAFLNARPG